MKYILKFVNGRQQILENVETVHQYKQKLIYLFTDGSKLEVLKRFLVSSEMVHPGAEVQTESVEDVFQRFDDFVSHFIDEVEQEVNKSSKYSITINEISQFKTALANSRNRKLKEVISLKP